MNTERPLSTAVAARPGAIRPLGTLGRIAIVIPALVGAVIAAPSGFGLFWFIPYAGVGAFLVVRRPGMSIGWILLALAWGFALVTLSVDATAGQFIDGSLGPVDAIIAVVSAAAGAAAFFLFALLSIVFPSGRLPGGRWGVAARLGLGVALFFVAAGAVMPTITVSLWGSASSMTVPNPAAVLPDLPIWGAVTPDTVMLPVAGLMVAAAVSLVVRYRRAAGIERQQYRWLSAALAFVVLAVVGGYIVGTLIPEIGDQGLQWLVAIVAFPCVPIAIGFAVLRYRLYDIDRIISRTISYAVVTAALVTVFAATILLFQAVLEPLTGGNTLAVAGSTLVVAALFAPVRSIVQRAVDRRFNRARYDAELTVAALARSLRDETNLTAIHDEVIRAVYGSLQPVGLGLWVRGE